MTSRTWTDSPYLTSPHWGGTLSGKTYLVPPASQEAAPRTSETINTKKII